MNNGLKDNKHQENCDDCDIVEKREKKIQRDTARYFNGDITLAEYLKSTEVDKEDAKFLLFELI